MIIEQLVIENFRSYHGTQTIRLNSGLDGARNLVAVGGLNGAGKTTLIDAVGFALLGQHNAFKFLKKKERKGDDKKLIERDRNSFLNREALRNGAREASVTLTIVDNDGKRYAVKRSWQFDNRGVFRGEEILVTPIGGGDRIGGDATTAEELREAFEDFLKNHVPPEIAGFFFFDGEEIQRIAEDHPEDTLRDGIERLLGFHVLDDLAIDMDKLQDGYRTETRKRSRQEEELDGLRVEEKRLDNRRRELEEEQQELEEKADKLKEETRQLASDLRDLVGGDGRDPKAIQQDLEDTAVAIKDIRRDLEQDFDRWITPAIPGMLVRQLAKQLEGEEARAQWEEGKRRVAPKCDQVVARVLGAEAPACKPPLVEAQASFLEHRFREEWDHLFNPPPGDIAKIVRHNQLSEEERSLARNRCLEILRGGAPDLNRKLVDLDVLERKARDLRQLVAGMGDGIQAAKLVAEKGRVDRELGEMEARWDERKRQLESVMTDLKEHRKQVRQREVELEHTGETATKADFARRVKRVIEEYKEALRPRKRDEITTHLTDMYRRLARKEDVVHRIELDERTFAPRLLDRRGNPIPLTSQSAGEREIYALSLLWALAKTSRRELPVIIDTPLARLDSAHRENIVTKYLPHAGHQVIVLSTDTEIDREHLHSIEKNIASSFRLEFDPATERTTVTEGYFDFQ